MQRSGLSGHKEPDLRKIALDVVARCLTVALSPEQRSELADSLVRQWNRYDKHAALFSENERVWVTLSEGGTGTTDVGVNHSPDNMVRHFLDDWDIEPAGVCAIIRDLNLNQSAELTNRRGERLRMSVDPCECKLGIEPA